MRDIVRRIYSKKMIDRLERKINLLGINNTLTLEKILYERIIITLLIFFMLLFLFNIYVGLICALIIYISFIDLLLSIEIKKYSKKIEKDAIIFFEVLVLALESGKNLINAIEVTVENIDSDLRDEFKYALEEVKLGKTLNEALYGIKSRVPSSTVQNIILNIEQSNRFGNNIINSMKEIVDYLREKRIMDIKTSINSIPVKISAISVVFIIPMILLLVLGPVIIELLGR